MKISTELQPEAFRASLATIKVNPDSLCFQYSSVMDKTPFVIAMFGLDTRFNKVFSHVTKRIRRRNTDGGGAVGTSTPQSIHF